MQLSQRMIPDPMQLLGENMYTGNSTMSGPLVIKRTRLEHIRHEYATLQTVPKKKGKYISSSKPKLDNAN